MNTLLNKVFDVKFWGLVLIVFVIALGAFYFWKLNGKNLIWCSTHSNECQVARISDVKEVADKIEKINR